MPKGKLNITLIVWEQKPKLLGIQDDDRVKTLNPM